MCTIHREYVRVFLHAANRETLAAERLIRLFDARKNKDSKDAGALWDGYFALRLASRESVEELRKHGGLLHLMHAQVDRTERGEYLVRGAL